MKPTTIQRLGGASMLLGAALFAAYSARAVPRAGGGLFLAGALLYGLGPALGTWGWLTGVFVLAGGCAVLGARLLRPVAP